MAKNSVNGKVVLITGAARGIGAGLAERLAAQGAKVALVGIEAEEQKAVADKIGAGAHAWEADVTSWDDLERATAGVVEHFGGIDIVIANAGIATSGFVRSVDPAAFEKVIEVDLLGVWRTFRVTLPHVIDRKGYLLAISSLAAITHAPGMANYAAAKAGVEAFCNSFRAEVAHLGVKVGVAHPTWIRTDLVESADKHPVFGKLRTGMPGLLGKTYPLSVALDHLQTGINKRARTVHVPRWVGGLKLIRAFLPPIIEIGAKSRIKKADAAALVDIERRGAYESSITGQAGRAATKKG
ncbi:SDR family oxidoreductase [Amycolatopsis regifaucium]|uniref:Short-chain dehydrogenase n=1 Tax=Amycolatopsis regifaucium TaxID=546365 RepID=A0A154ML71_9PSEU|nr:SDR family oxidoreductase [Amycolatopsis regifaucium]KZB85108.1 short-chain dehydrogenase [Amycolatopsis regifaucium]OKA04132.1 short-chain dehydrogenase [Amycolatopsis regifaucium]SFH93717.1 NADP-dependent 3-hydroxy acid dehydrogenase YdfG [Amycolatopsis regifaucium]